ncbi:transposase [Neopusillimonas aromaticivorans]|nr:transposase [Neopusillimonas aromaticivorans]WJJ94441.1 transposase [Neopusillimonas aromaticivorans]
MSCRSSLHVPCRGKTPDQSVHLNLTTTLERQQLKRRQAIEPIIGHLKADHRMDRCHLKGEEGDRLHAVLCAAGYNLKWLLRMIAKKGCPSCMRFLRLKKGTAVRALLTALAWEAGADQLNRHRSVMQRPMLAA